MILLGDPAFLFAPFLLHEIDDNSEVGTSIRGDQFRELFHDTGDIDDGGRTITAYEDAAAHLSPDDSRLGRFLHNISIWYLNRYTRFRRSDDLQRMIETIAKLIEVKLPAESPDFPWLVNLGNAYYCRFAQTEDPNDLSLAIKHQQRALQLTPDGHFSLLVQRENLALSFSRRFHCSGNLDDISEAIKNHQQALQLTADGDPNLPGRLSNLGMSFVGRFQQTEDLEDISEAIENHQRAVRLTPDGHASLPNRFNNLGTSYLCRFQRTGDLDDISGAIKNQQDALQLTPDGRDDKLAQLNNLAASYLSRFNRTGDLDDISEAIKIHHRSLRLTPDGHASLPVQLNNLGTAFFKRFDRTDDLDDIFEAIKNLQSALDLTPRQHPNLPNLLYNLGLSFLGRFKYTGDLNDITEAIGNQQRAVQLTPDGHANLPELLTGLGSSFSGRFDRTGDLDDVFEAIKNQQRAVQLTPDGHDSLPNRLHNLAGSFSGRFERTGDIADISEAIRNHQLAVQLIPHGHPNLVKLLNDLGLSFSRRFNHTRHMDDISEAIKTHQYALQLIPDGDANLPTHQSNLGLAFVHRFDHTQDPGDISEAIKNQRRALELTPDGHASLPVHLNNLGTSFQRRFAHSGDKDDISEAIDNYQRALQMTPDGHPDLPSRHSNLGYTFLCRFECTGDMDDLEKAVSSYRRSAISPTGPSSVRLLAAKHWATLTRKSPSCSSQLLDAHACIIQLLTRISGLENTVQHRHEALVNSSQLSIAASAAALSLGHVDKALEWLVEGRCIIWNQINQLRTPVDELRAHDQALADRFSAISRELEIAGSRSQSLTIDSGTDLSLAKFSLEEQAGKHIKLAKERDRLLDIIRNIPGFEDFLQPKKCDDIMRGLPDEGVIVIINVHNDRSDALALMAGADEPMHIPLPNFSYHQAEHLAMGLRGHLLRHNVISRLCIPLDDPTFPNIDLAEVLSVLWSQVVWPILESLAFSESSLASDKSESFAKLPRIWWCPTGPLAFLPIHAAGIYDRSKFNGMPNQCLSDFAVSSYIPTINPLLKTSKSNPAENRVDIPTGWLIVSQPNTPKRSQILGAADEAHKVARQLEKRGISSLTLVDQYGTVEAVSKAMESFSCIHVACHALQNTTSPLKSSIHLHDGPLDLSEIMKKNLPNSDFAFLSACQTSTGDRNLPEEVVHLVAGMLAAGYRSVVGTMWSIVDTHGPDIAESFYETLLDDSDATSEGSKTDGGRAARALHVATQRFREKTSDSLLVWVPYIHIGI